MMTVPGKCAIVSERTGMDGGANTGNIPHGIKTAQNNQKPCSRMTALTGKASGGLKTDRKKASILTTTDIA